MATFTIAGDCRVTLTRLFEIEADHLRFGWSGRSVEPAELTDLLVRAVRFRDYIMEGFLTYNVHVEDLAPGCRLRVSGEGSDRDKHIRSQVQFYLKQAHATVQNEDAAEPNSEIDSDGSA